MHTHIIAVIDASSSMSCIAREASDGFNTFVREQAALPGEATLSLLEFSDHVRPIHSGIPIDRFPGYHLRPSGMTALLDGIGAGIQIGDNTHADQTVVAILTDGGENRSRKFGHRQIVEMISTRQARGWSFVFLAANQDAFATARQYGIDDRYVANFAYSGDGATQAMRSLSTMTAQIRGTTF